MAYRSTSAKPSSTGPSDLPLMYRAGKSLADIISDDPVDPGSVLQTFIDILNSLATIHAHHWSHVPLTPASIRFNEQGEAEIANYPTPGTQSTVIFGSAKYAVPDALHQGIERQGCAELDSYILGFIFYEFLLGKRLFGEEFKKVNKTSASSWLTWHANLAECARPLTEVISQFPPRLSQIVSGMMEKDPEKRTTDLTRISENLQSTIANTLVITNLTSLGRHENTPTEVRMAATSSHPINRTEQAALGILRAVRGKYRAFPMQGALARLLPIFLSSRRSVARRLFTKLRGKTTTGGIESVVWQAARIMGGPRFYLSIAGLVFLGLPVWLWKSTARSTDVPASLPPLILTDTGEMVLVRAEEVAAAAGAHRLELRRQTVLTTFYIDRHEVASRHYWKFCHATGRSLPVNPVWDLQYAERPDNPILNVSLNDADAFAEWAGKWLPSVLEWKVASATASHLLDFYAFETAPPGVRTLTWADATFLDPLAQSGLAIRTDTDRNVLVTVPVSDLDGTEAIPFRCAASSEILQTPHFLGKANSSQSGFPR